MALSKCPRCELNYIKEGEQFCNICRRSMNLKQVREEPEQNLCADCGENPAMKGKELCAYCFTDKKRREKLEKLMDGHPSQTIIDMDQFDEVEVDEPSDIPSEDLEDIHEEFGDGEEEAEDEDELFDDRDDFEFDEDE
ncbi:hypothetical protein LJC42_03470 [Eubacteriales bacterium OttesenSCG-928-K08]|nr:hypothetical protein [Eubacteriales bacterium OttesenSCG-928-K08]